MGFFSKIKNAKAAAATAPATGPEKAAVVPFEERALYIPRHAVRDAAQCSPDKFRADEKALFEKAHENRRQRELQGPDRDEITSVRSGNPKLFRHSSYMSDYRSPGSLTPHQRNSMSGMSSRASSYHNLTALDQFPMPAMPAKYAGSTATVGISAASTPGPSTPRSPLSRNGSFQSRPLMAPVEEDSIEPKRAGSSSPLRTAMSADGSVDGFDENAASIDSADESSGSVRSASSDAGEPLELQPATPQLAPVTPMIDSAHATPLLKLGKTPRIEVVAVSPEGGPEYFSQAPVQSTVESQVVAAAAPPAKKMRFSMLRRSRVMAVAAH